MPGNLPPDEQVVIHALNGNRLYWNAEHNRWFIQGISELEQLNRRDHYVPAPAAQFIARELPGINFTRSFPFPVLKTKSKNSLFLNPGAELMHFNNLSDNEKINAMKQEFTAIVKSFFEKPEVLKTYVASNKLSKEQAKNIFINLNKFNINKCICCRKFDPSLLKTPIDSEFEPLIELAQTTAKTKAY